MMDNSQSDFNKSLIKDFSYDEERREFNKLFKLTQKIRQKDTNFLLSIRNRILSYKDYPLLKITKKEALKLLPDFVNFELNKKMALTCLIIN